MKEMDNTMLIRLCDTVERILCVISAICLMVFVVVVTTRVVARNTDTASLPWADEVAMMAFAWAIFIGAAIGVRRGSHYIIEVYPERWTAWKSLLDTLSAVAVGGIASYLMVYQGAKFTVLNGSREFQYLGVPQSWTSVSLVFAGLCIVLFTVEKLINAPGAQAGQD